MPARPSPSYHVTKPVPSIPAEESGFGTQFSPVLPDCSSLMVCTPTPPSLTSSISPTRPGFISTVTRLFSIKLRRFDRRFTRFALACEGDAMYSVLKFNSLTRLLQLTENASAPLHPLLAWASPAAPFLHLPEFR